MKDPLNAAVLLLASLCRAFAGQADTAQPPPILVDPGKYSAARHGGPYMWNYYVPPAPGTTPWAPCWSPDGKWIAVAMRGSIWKVDPLTGEASEVTMSAGYASSPAWSPDGKWIVYTTDYERKRVRLEAVDLSTGACHALTDDNHLYVDPVFSPDGTRLAYVSTQPNGYFNIYVRAIRDGRWDGDPIAVTTDHAYPCDRLYFGPWDLHIEPAWTPDGKELVFVSNRDVPLGSGDLWRAPARAGGMGEATRLLHEQSLYRMRPHVSPDGKRIVYSSMAGGADQFNNLYLVPIGGGAPYKLTFGSYDRFPPRWSPDGEWIAYISNETGPPQLCLLETWGGAQKNIRIAARRWRRAISNYERTAIDSLYPTNTDIFRKAKAQGGITGYVHPFGDTDPLESGLGAKAFPVDAALGALDAIEWSGAVRAQMAVWYRMLNNDIALVPVGGEDSINDLHTLRTLGAIRTYVRLDGPLSADAWLEGIRKGRTFFTTGPLIEFRVDGRLPGGVIRLPAGGGAVLAEGTVRSIAPLSKVLLYHRRGVLREIPLDVKGAAAHFSERIQVSESDWFSLAAEGPHDPRLDAAYGLAATNTVRVYVADRKIRDRASAEYFIRWIAKLREEAEKWPWWASQAEKDHVLAQYEEARRVYEKFSEEAW